MRQIIDILTAFGLLVVMIIPMILVYIVIRIDSDAFLLGNLDPLIKNHVENNSISIVLPKKNIIKRLLLL